MTATHPPHLDRDVDPAATCFFNALLRETPAWRLVDEATGSTAVLPVDGGELHLRLRHRGAGGECRFRWPVLRREGARRGPVTFEAALDRVLATPALVEEPGCAALRAFRERVLESCANTRAGLATRSDLTHLQRGPLTFAEAEQGLLAGHAFHPAPKSRDPFRADEARAYCPEHRVRFALCWWAVAPEVLAGRSSRAAPAAELTGSLLPDALRRRLPEGFAPLPMHPWQALRLRRSREVATLEASGLLHWLGHGEPGWLPTSSHRSLYAPRAPWMVKGSLSARLTNSLRLLSVREVERGLSLDTWTCNGELGERFPGFALMQEPAWLGWRAGRSGEVNPASLVILRENPLRDDPGAEAVMLATLTQQPLTAGGESLLAARARAVADRRGRPLAETAREWFAAFCERVLTPLFGLVVEDGIVLLAHQQNIVLRLDRGWPVGLYYRDCQGSGVSERFRERHPAARPPEPCWPRETVRRYFLYYVLVNSTFAVTGALAADGLVDEAVLLADLRAHLEALRGRLDGDHDCLESALTAPRLAAKGNFFCYLDGINEATLADPARIYLTVPNPLAPLARDRAAGTAQGATA